MKKVLLSIICLLFFAGFIFVYKSSSDLFKVLEIVTPLEIYIDTDRNLIFNEDKPFIIENLYYIDENKDYSLDSVLKDLTLEEKIYLSYSAKKISSLLLKNRFVKTSASDIFVGGKSYRQLLVDSGFFYSNDEKSKSDLVKRTKNMNINDYVIYNYRTGKIHKLSCEKGLSGKKYVIVKKSEIKGKYDECPFCFESKKVFIKKEKYNNKYKKERNNSNDKNHLKFPEIKKILKVDELYKADGITVYFIDLNKIMKPSSSCGNKACSDLKKEIDNAEKTIDFAIYGIDRQPEIEKALINAQNRGVKLRWVFDFDKKEENYYKDTVILKDKIKNHITDEQYDKNNKSAIMHNKFFVFDGKKVWTGSANISNTDLSGFNANYALLIVSKELASVYTEEFEQMYNGVFHTHKKKINKDYIKINSDTSVLPLFSPADKILENYIIKEISSAKSYIYMPVFFITSNELVNPLIDAHNRGVEVKIIDDATNSHNKYTVHKKLREAGITVKTENFAGKMHMKTVIIDDKTSIIGSMNFTKSGNLRNDENVLIIKSSPLTEYLKSTFVYLWNKIPEKYEKFDPPAESKYSVGSCSDGVDNDFDGKIDAADDSCSYK